MPRQKTSRRAKTVSRKKAAKAPAAGKKPPQGPAEPLLDFLGSSPIGAIISKVDDGQILHINQAAAQFFEISPRSAIGLTTTAFFARPLERHALIERMKKEGGVRRHPLRTRTADGQERSCLITNRPIVYRGAPAILTWVEDETERQQKEHVLQATAGQVELVHRIAGIANRAVNFYDALRQGSAEIGAFLEWPIRIVYRLAHGNDNLLEIATYSVTKELTGDEFLKSILFGKSFGPGDDLPGRVLATAQSVWVEDVAADPALARFINARRYVASAIGIPVVGNDKVVAVLEFLSQGAMPLDELLLLTLQRVGLELGRVYLRDLTTVALQEARAEAESSSRAKASFLAAMSHEVRTPMNGVVGMVDLVLQTKLDADQRVMLQTVKDSGHALIKVINDILDFSKIDAGRLEIEAAEIALSRIVEDVAVSLSPSAMDKGLRIVSFVDPRLPDLVIGDAVRVRQILSNLGGNAVKFSSEGEVVIKAERLPDTSDGKLRVRFSVKDEGIGISAEAQRRLFEEFSQADSSTTRKFGGTGLGLAISHRLTTLMGGQIGVESAIGKGTEFRCVLPFGASSTLSVPAAATDDLSGLRLMIIARSAEVRDACRIYLEHWKADVVLVADLRECLPVYETSRDAGDPIDIIIIPDADDHQQVAGLRKRFIETGHLPYPRFVVGRDPRHPGEILRNIEEVTLLDVSPMRRAGLISAVAVAAGRASPEVQHVEQSQAGPAVTAPTVEEALATGRLILVAEDHIANREVLRRQLNRLGYACEIANDGAAALALWRSKSYALLLTDCHMPEMDGFALTAAIRKAEKAAGRRAPIIAITANVLQGEAERCLAAGMDDFLPKPVELPTLKACLEKWMPEAAPATPISAPEAPPPASDGPIVLDLTLMQQTFGEINDDAREMFGLFLESIQPLLVKFDEELGQSNHRAARETIHKARGAVANAGGKELAAIMAGVEQAFLEDKPDEAQRRSAAIAPAWQRLQRAIAEV